MLDAGGPVNMEISYNGATNASSITTLHIPSYNELTSNLDFAGREVEDTYILGGVPDPQLVGAELTSLEKIDFTDAAKIQIRDITSIMNGVSGEVELVFGDDVVIADPTDADQSTFNYACSGSCSSISDNDSNPYGSATGAFEGLSVKITNLNKVKYIGWNAFRNANLNSASRNITINSNQTVGGYVFAGSNIESLSIDTAEIGQGFAKNATSLSSLTIGSHVTDIRASAFNGTTALAQTVDTKNTVNIWVQAFKDSAITGVTFGNSLSMISFGAFMNTNLSSNVTFGDSNYTVGQYSFYNAGITSLNLKNITNAGYYSFANNSITEIVLPKSYRINGKSIDYYNGEPWITSTYILENNPLKKVTFAFDLAATRYYGSDYMPMIFLLGNNVWNNTLEEITVLAPYDTDEPAAADHDFGYSGQRASDNYNMVVDTNLANSIKNVIPKNAFTSTPGSGADAKPKTIILDDRIEMIGSLAFDYTHIVDLKTIDKNGNVSEDTRLPADLKVIGSQAFEYSFYNYPSDSPKLTMDSLPSGLRYIGSGAFLYDYYFTLNNLDLEDLEYLGSWAFYMAQVKNIVLHDFRSNGGQVIFMGDNSIKNVTIDYDIFGPDYTNGNSGTFSDVYGGWLAGLNDTHNIHFEKIKFTSKATTAPHGNPGQFQRVYADEIDLSETPWKDFGNTGPIFHAAKIGTLKLPSNLETIGENMFQEAEITNPVTIPETVTRIENRAFARMDHYYENGKGVKITSLPNSIEHIGFAAFYDSKAFAADVNLPNLNYIGYSAFQGSGITGVTLSDNIQTLGYNAFYNANDLKDVTIDLDLYSVTREYGDTEWGLGSCWQQDGQQCPSSASDAQKRALRDANLYDSFVSTFSKTANYGTVTFTEKAGEPCGGDLDSCTKDRPYFYGIKAEKVDLSATNWTYIAPSMFQAAKVGEIVLPNGLVTIGEDAFFRAEMNSTILPASLKTIGVEAFQWAKARINQLPEGLKTIDDSAFYEADVTDDLVIPAGITKIGKDAFNANSEDIHYNSITLKGDLTYTITSDQPIFVVFYNAVVDKMIVESADLPALHANDGIPEFHAMRMKEVVLTKLPEISANAFEECDRLEKVDARADSALRAIDDEAFINDVKLKSFLFSTGLKNETVTIGKRAFQGTAFETMGDSSKDFDLTAANFEAMDGYAFSGMPKLRTVDIPRNFSHATIPVATFYNDTALEEATLDYKITLMDDAAFAQDVKLKRIFIWGNTVVKDETLDGYTEPAYYGHGGPSGGSTRGAGLGVTIPENTDIYAYSTSPTESYAAYDGRDDFDGTFYPLDEVIYLTSNNPTVLINEDSTDFDKSDLIIYGLRRDGVVLESDSWQQFDGKVYARSAKPLTFEKMAATIAADPAFGTVYDTPVPINELSLENENFANIGFELVPSEDDPSIRVVNIIYTDAYTDGKPDTDIDPYREPEPATTPAPKPDKKTNPDTSSDNMGKYFAILVGCTGAAAAAIAASRLRKKISL